ncbi:MAG TPA: hypothetical protein VM661_13420 [Candidatus Sulfotelmatobacter sp.]|jgi:hypothetical protein|nr:hypothetical protein [Candidatus Sulfotelmatobacter sp.]
MSNQVTLYPNPIGQPLPGSTPLAVCFSGGGSRSLTCTLGQLSALSTLPDPLNPKQMLIKRVAAISAVSGGSWASVPYTYLSASVADSDFLITPQAPSALVKKSAGTASPANVAYLAPQCLGNVPGKFGDWGIAGFVAEWLLLRKLYNIPWSWLWIVAVGQFVLKDFGLYDVAYGSAGVLPKKSFSQSADYVQKNILPNNSGLTTSSFYYPRAGRPSLIVNYNMLEDIAGAPQIPVQATVTGTGCPGQSPDAAIQGGGLCESFGFGSTLLAGGSATGPAPVTLSRLYSLCDITGCSSAFFAQWLQQHLGGYLDKAIKEAETAPTKFGFAAVEGALAKTELTKLQAELKALEEQPLAIVPQYDYWPLSQVTAPSPVTTNYGFADGGAFENTGLMGLLTRTTGDIKTIVFVNTSTALSIDSHKTLVVDDQLSLLFGLQAYKNGSYPSFGGMNPSQPMSYVQLFSSDRFADLLAQLSANSCNGTSSPNSGVAWAMQTLTTIANPVANVAAGRKVEVLWVYNNRVNTWQNAITDKAILADLAAGQGASPSGSLANFPSYGTIDIHLDAEAVNMLAQLSAWSLTQLQPQISTLLSS